MAKTKKSKKEQEKGQGLFPVIVLGVIAIFCVDTIIRIIIWLLVVLVAGLLGLWFYDKASKRYNFKIKLKANKRKPNNMFIK